VNINCEKLVVFYLLITTNFRFRPKDDPIELFHCHLFDASRGMPGGFLGVGRGFRGAYPQETPRKVSPNSQVSLLIHKTNAYNML
jgi:hypothetical protein